MKTAQVESPFWDVKTAAPYVRLSRHTLYEKAKREEIPCRRHGSRIFFVKEELDEWSKSTAMVAHSRPSQSEKRSVRPIRRSTKKRDVRSLIINHTARLVP